MKGKKGGVGELVTWVAAFVLVFFIMMTFFISSAYIASEPIKLEISEEKDRLEFNKNSFHKEILIQPDKIKFVKKIQDER